MNFTDRRSAGLELARQQRAQRQDKRAADMYQAYLRGMTLVEVGRLYGVGGERVRQIFHWNGLPRRRQGWQPPA